MLSFVQNFFASRANPIGVDFGTDSLRLAQVALCDGEHKLVAAASADVPSHIRNNPAERLRFFVETTRDLLAQGNFRARQAILAMPAAGMYIQHLRLAKLDDEEMRKALSWEARGKLPIDPGKALMRHIVAGEVYQDQEPRSEVILLAAARDAVENFLSAGAKAKLDVIGMNVEPRAVVDCFSHIYRRRSDADVTNCFIDIGCGSTRAVIARGGEILFARSIPIGGDHFNRAASTALKISFEETKMKRLQIAHSSAAPETNASDDAAVNAPPKLDPAIAQDAQRIDAAVAEPLSKLIAELELCRRYYEATFPSNPVAKLIFIGGEARQRQLCLHMAREMGLAAQIGDPLVRMGRISEISIESGIDRRQPQPAWAVAIGLSMGPVRASKETIAAAKE